MATKIKCLDAFMSNGYVIVIKSGWNYAEKFEKAFEENNLKYIDKLFKKGIVKIIK